MTRWRREVQPIDIEYINAHGSGTKQNDRHETAAYKQALGDRAYEIPISSIKSMIGHSLGAIGAIEMAACALAIDRGVVPPTANWENPDPECDLDYTPKVARHTTVQAALSTGSGFGFQSAMCSRSQRRSGRCPRESRRAERAAPEPGFAESPMVMSPDKKRRAVFTGIGVVAPNGSDTGSWWDATRSGKSGIGPITHFDAGKYDTQLAGQVEDFSADDHIERRLQVQTDRWTHMALATQMALDDAQLEPFGEDPYSMSVITASSSGGNEFGQREIQALWAKDPVSSAPTSRSPGSTRPLRARSRSATT